MSNMVPFAKGGVPAEIAAAFAADANNEFSSGITASFPVLSVRGKVFRIKHKGTEAPVLTPDGNPVPSLNVVLLRANEGLTKIYYAKQYEEGDDNQPDCYSNNGIKPDPSSRNPQSATCDTCRHNRWGSRITDSGAKAKACQDGKRLALVPAADPANAAMDGSPLLLRVSPTSLSGFDSYIKELSAHSVKVYHIATRISFDMNAAYPKLTFAVATHPDGSAWFMDGPTREQLETLRNSDACMQVVQNEPIAPHADEQKAAPAPTPATSPVAQPIADTGVTIAESAAKAVPPQAPAPEPAAQASSVEGATSSPETETKAAEPAVETPSKSTDAIVGSLLG